MQVRKSIFDVSIRNFIYGVLVIVLFGSFFFTVFVFISARTLINGGKFVDYVGKSRAGVQRSVKVALSGKDPQRNIDNVENLLKVISEGSEELGIPKYEKKQFRMKLDEVKNKWEEVKSLMNKVRENKGDYVAVEKLFEESEILFTLTDELVGLSDDYVKERSIFITIAPLIIFMFSLLFILFALIFGRRLNKNVSNIMQGLNRVAEGDFAETLQSGGGRELSFIIGNANQLIASLSSLIEKIYDSVIKVYASSELFLSTSSKVYNLNQKLSSQVSQISSAAEEMSKAVEEIEKVAVHSKETAEKSMEISKQVRSLSDEAVNLMNQAYESTLQLFNTLSVLVDDIMGIGNVVKLIKDIADQINILAINASIEAARAGEQGKGFAVVAAEVRKLAESTIRSSNEISQKISVIQSKSQDTLSSMKGALGNLNNVKDFILKLKEVIELTIGSFSEVSKDMAHISSSVSEQAAVSREVAKNTMTISAMSEEVTKETKDILSSAIKIISEVDELRERAMVFKIKGKEKVILDLAKTDHRVWVAKVYGHIWGLLKLDLSAIPDHTKCKLGRWYYSEGVKTFGKFSVFRELEVVHKRIHSLGMEILTSYERGDVKRAFEVFPELERTSQEVLRLLDELKKYAT